MTETTDSFSKKGNHPLTPIQEFYHGKTIFITGGTGFLGKVLIEKLIRSCPGVKALYLLIRSKKGKSADERLRELWQEFLFEKVRKENENWHNKIFPISGDCTLPGLGISESDRQLLTCNVDVVFHVAATVRFDEALKKAVQTNTIATQEVMNLCYSMQHLEALVYVSTAYACCYLKRIEEKVYEPSPHYEDAITLIKNSTEEEILAETERILQKWPNTYTYTKGLAEYIVQQSEGILPVCIFRPGIVTSTCFEPLPGWIDNMLGPTGIVLGAGCGLVRTMQCNTQAEANIVPADLVINGILAAGSETNKNFRKNDKKIKVYNFVSSTDNPISYGKFINIIEEFGITIPSIKAIWYYSLTLCESRFVTVLMCLLLHLFPAFLVDIACVLTGKKPQMTKIYNRIHKMIKALGYFATIRWDFVTDNVRRLWHDTTEEDKKIFNFDICSIHWDSYSKNYVTGARVYVLKEDLSNLPEALKRWNRLYWYHQILKISFITLLFTMCWYGVQRIIST